MNDNNSDQSQNQNSDESAVTEAKVDEPKTEETAKSSESEATSEMEGSSEASSKTSENNTSEPSGASTTDELTPAVEPDEQASEEEAENQTQPSEDQESDEPAPAAEATETPKNDNPNAKWYVVHTYSGHENKVAHTLKQRIESEHLEKKILDVLVPMQDKIEIKSGKKINIKEKIFPGYILVKMVLDDISWLAVRTTQGVTSFVGMGNKPTPISDAEVQTIVKFTQTEAPMYKQVFLANDTVKIVDGPFADFIGKIDSVDEEKGKVRVLVSIFGRETPVELDFLQIKKI